MITIFTETKTKRLQYTLQVMFKHVLGEEFSIIADWDRFQKLDLPKINYSKKKHEGIINIKPHTLLFETDIKNIKPAVSTHDGLPAFFFTSKETYFPFDVFAAAFYLFSRYEEYQEHKSDKHGRFNVYESIAYTESFLEIPLVNLWAQRIKSILHSQNQSYLFQSQAFSYVSTIDIDMAFTFKNKGLWRTIGGFTRELLNLNLKKIEKYVKVIQGKEEDPFNNFEYQHQIHQRYGTKAIYFVLIGDYGKYDKNINFENEDFIDIIQRLSLNYPVGIHPSYSSNKIKKSLDKEIKRLENIILDDVVLSRQHFLKLDIRETYKALVKLGIKEDHSMGYSELPGFRASICSAYPFFDLDKNETLPITIYPFCVMDVALNRFLKLGVAESIKRIEKLMAEVKKVNGSFISVFHNESLSDFDNWRGWREVYEKMLSLAQSEQDTIPSEPGYKPLEMG